MISVKLLEAWLFGLGLGIACVSILDILIGILNLYNNKKEN